MTAECGHITCPQCGACNNESDVVDIGDQTDTGAQPRGGDLSICGHCYYPARYVESDQGIELHPLTEEEWAQVKRDPRIANVINVLDEVDTPNEAAELYRARHG